jgi:hypothetical protein
MKSVNAIFWFAAAIIQSAQAFSSLNLLRPANLLQIRTHQANISLWNNKPLQRLNTNSFFERKNRKSRNFVSSLSGVDALGSGKEDSNQVAKDTKKITRKKLPIFDRSYDREIWSIALPSYTAMMLDPIATIIDMSYIGRIPEATLSLAGIGISNTILNYFGFTFFFIVVTTTTAVAQTLATAAAGLPSFGLHPPPI